MKEIPLKTILLLSALSISLLAHSQTENNDTIKKQDLQEVVVEADPQRLTASSTVYTPTARQKNASQTAIDLINRLGITEVTVDLITNKVETHDRQPVAIFIDYIPASDSDLKGMRMSDVRKVEYYDYPSDPRLQGKQHVVNFIMVKYEYGGYVKLYGNEDFIKNTGLLQANAKLQYKRMTYDLMGYGFYSSNNHQGNQDLETFRLPQDDGTMKVFNRYSSVNGSRNRKQNYMSTFRATYSSDKVYAASLFSAGTNPSPHIDQNGVVTYEPQDFPSSEYTSKSSNFSKFLQYNGNYYFYLPKGNNIYFLPSYTYSHTSRNSVYTETGFLPISNGAYDNTNNFKFNLKYSHDFGKGGNLTLFAKEDYNHSRTQYVGSAVSLERNRMSTTGVGSYYSLTKGGFNVEAGFGWNWTAMRTNDVTDHTNSPWGEISVAYKINKHRISADYSFSRWEPSFSFKSENVIESSPLMKYTGNPNLVPFKSNSLSARYSYTASKNFYMSVYGSSWIVGDRYVYDYEASPTGILRTIKQPLGHYAIGTYGLSATGWMLNRSVALQGSVGQRWAFNGKPYDYDKYYIFYRLSAFYYLKNFSFSANYSSDDGWSDGCMVGGWVRAKDSYYLLASWGNSKFNVRVMASNFFRWNYRANIMTTRSRYYDYVRQYIDLYSHASVSLSLTYTSGFGKKVKQGNEPGARNAASSGILNN